MTPRLDKLSIRNYRSFGNDGASITLPEAGPLVIVGENNAGKSNITRAVELMFGERWPGTMEPDDHDFHLRDRHDTKIALGANVSGLACPCNYGEIDYIRWHYDMSREEGPCDFSRNCSRHSCNRTFLSNAIRMQLFSMSVGSSNRDLLYQLSYSSKYTLLSKLMHRFHQELVADEDRVEALKAIFANIMAQFDTVTEFADFRSILVETTVMLGQSLAYRLDIDFSAYDPSNFYRSLRVHPHFAHEMRSFDELGTGQTQILGMAFAYAYAKAFGRQDGLLLLVDEPESHLHPLAQQWLAVKLSGLVTEGLQVIITTHSPYFIDLAQPENLVVVRRGDASAPSTVMQATRGELVSELVQRGVPPGRVTEESVGEYYSAVVTPDVISGLFARACVLVEGRTEAFALPELLRFVGLDPLALGVAFIAADGISSIAKWHRLFSVFGIPTYIVFDGDSDKTGQDAESCRAARIDIMAALGRPGEDADVVERSPLEVAADMACLDPNFEGAMATLLGNWTRLVTEAREVVGGSKASKPLVARYVARRLSAEDLSNTARQALSSLADAIRDLLRMPETDLSRNGPVAAGGSVLVDDEPPF